MKLSSIMSNNALTERFLAVAAFRAEWSLGNISNNLNRSVEDIGEYLKDTYPIVQLDDILDIKELSRRLEDEVSPEHERSYWMRYESGETVREFLNHCAYKEQLSKGFSYGDIAANVGVTIADVLCVEHEPDLQRLRLLYRWMCGDTVSELGDNAVDILNSMNYACIPGEYSIRDVNWLIKLGLRLPEVRYGYVYRDLPKFVYETYGGGSVHLHIDELRSRYERSS